MAWKYNPFTDSLDQTGSGGASYIDGVVADSSLLPVTLGSPALDSVYLAKAGSGLWLVNRKPAGLYVRVANNGVAADWQYLGAFPEVNADGNWELYNSADPTKELKFSLSSITTGTTRTLTVPDRNLIVAPSEFRVVTSSQTLVIGDRVAADTTSSAFALTLPASPANGDTLEISDHAATFGSNALTLNRNGNIIEGLAENLVCNVSRALFTLVWVGGSVGWRIVAQSAAPITTNTANTWTANQTFDGTNNVAPNQTAASGSSLMTRDLVDARNTALWVPMSGRANFTAANGVANAFSPWGVIGTGDCYLVPSTHLTLRALYINIAFTTAPIAPTFGVELLFGNSSGANAVSGSVTQTVTGTVTNISGNRYKWELDAPTVLTPSTNGGAYYISYVGFVNNSGGSLTTAAGNVQAQGYMLLTP